MVVHVRITEFDKHTARLGAKKGTGGNRGEHLHLCAKAGEQR